VINFLRFFFGTKEQYNVMRTVLAMGYNEVRIERHTIPLPEILGSKMGSGSGSWGIRYSYQLCYRLPPLK
jgi:hypothetical protein